MIPAGPDSPDQPGPLTQAIDRPWLRRYPAGMPAEVNLNAFAALPDVLRQSCQRFGQRPAFASLGAQLSYDELDAHSRAFAAFVQQGLGLHPGDRLALMLPNLLQYPVALFGALRAGLVVVNLNPRSTADELEALLLDSGPRAVVVLENFAHTLQQVLVRQPSLAPAVITTEVGDMLPLVQELITNAVVKYGRKQVPHWSIAGSLEFNATLRGGQGMALAPVPLGHADPAFLQYTGGTTGAPKAAVLSHGNLVANVQQLSAWIGPSLVEGHEILICPLPLYHVYALGTSLVFMKLGALNVLVSDPRDMHAFIGQLKRQPFTAIIGVNTLYRALLDAPGFTEVDTSHLKLACAGGMAVQQAVAERWQAATGVPLVEAYGLTEASPGVTANRLDTPGWTGSAGLPLPSTDFAILDDDGWPVAAGEVGELCVRGPQVMSGYWRRPVETAQAFNTDHWLRTGDMGTMDADGAVWITDRKKDMVNVSGYKVWPHQIEEAVALHPGVAEVAAIGVPDEQSGEALLVIVVPKDPGLTAAALMLHCRRLLSGYKLPRHIVFRTEPLPRNGMGKVLRRALRDVRAPVLVQRAAAAPLR